MEAEEGCGASGGDIALYECADSCSLALTGSEEKDLASLENAMYTHSERVLRNVSLGREEAGVSLDGVGGKLNEVSKSLKLSVGLVEADVAVSADTENLNVGAAESVDLSLVLAAELAYVLCSSVGNAGVSLVDVNSVEEVLVHKVAVALIVVGSNGVVLVEKPSNARRKRRPLTELPKEPLMAKAGGTEVM